MYSIVERVFKVVDDNGLTEVEAIVLWVGEDSGVISRYLHACYPVAVDGTMLENTSLEIEILTAKAVCRGCGKTFPVKTSKGICPRCEGADCEVISGREFMIKEIRAR